MKTRSTVPNPIAAPTIAAALALGAAGAGSSPAAAGPLDTWFGVLPAPAAQTAAAPEEAAAPAPAPDTDPSSAALRGQLAAAERRIAELEAELEETRAQAAWLADELEASWRWIEELNAVLAEGRPAADGEPVETAAAPQEGEEPAAGAGRAPVETAAAAAPEDEEPTAAGAGRAPAETVTAAPEVADDGGRPGDDGEGVAARLARALDGRGRPGGGDGGGIAARLARTLDALGSRRPQPTAPATGDRPTTGPQQGEDGPPAAAFRQPQQQPPSPPPQADDAAPYYAATEPVNLRAEPTTSARVLAVVQADDTVRLLDRERGWYRVRYTTSTSREVTGWVYGEFLRAVEPAEALAVLAPPA